ncbi:MAG: hypothetical protein ABIK85_00540 [Candidatus Eisenbacteria bacterium]
MRALLLLVLLLALIALFSFHEPLIPYWKNRFPAVMSCLDEGRYSDALAAAMAGNVPGEEGTRWSKSEPLGEAAPAGEPAPADEPAPVEEPAPADQAAPDVPTDSLAAHAAPVGRS